jgi:hypothetical protein
MGNFFRHSGWIVVTAFLAVAGTVTASLRFHGRYDVQLTTTIGGGALGFVYFVQKQRLDELRLFHDLFTKFNDRYDGLNGTLNGILEGEAEAPLTQEQTDCLSDYFNLCAEEFFFYRQRRPSAAAPGPVLAGGRPPEGHRHQPPPLV